MKHEHSHLARSICSTVSIQSMRTSSGRTAQIKWVLARNLHAYAVTQRPGAMMKDVSFGGQLAKLHLNKLAGLWRQTSSPIA